MNLKQLKSTVAKLDRLIDKMVAPKGDTKENISRYEKLMNSIREEFVPKNKFFTDSKEFLQLSMPHRLIVRHFYTEHRELKPRHRY